MCSCVEVTSVYSDLLLKHSSREQAERAGYPLNYLGYWDKDLSRVFVHVLCHYGHVLLGIEPTCNDRTSSHSS